MNDQKSMPIAILGGMLIGLVVRNILLIQIAALYAGIAGIFVSAAVAYFIALALQK